MLEGLVARWPIMAVRGVCAILFGLVAIVWPGAALLTLAVLFGAYAFASGLLSGVLAFTRQPPQARWLLAVEAVIGIVAGFVALAQLGLTVMTLLAVVGIWAIIAGVSRIIQAVRLRQQLTDEWMLGASGVLLTLLGILVLARPITGAVAIAWTMGILAIALGCAELALASKLRSVAQRGPAVWSMRAEEPQEVAKKRER